MRERRFLRLGLTGGIASGKSTVARVLEGLGCGTIDADRCSRDAVAPGTEGRRRVEEEFGDAVFQPDGALDRGRMRALVFSDREKRRRLEAIVHPLVFVEVMRALERFEREGKKAGVVEAALIFETAAAFGLDAVIAVVAGRENQRRRLSERSRWRKAEIEGVLDAQTSDAERTEKADYVIRNFGRIADLEKSVRETWAKIIKERT